MYNVCNGDKEKDAVNLRMAEGHREGLEGAKGVGTRCNSISGTIFGNKRKY